MWKFVIFKFLKQNLCFFKDEQDDPSYRGLVILWYLKNNLVIIFWWFFEKMDFKVKKIMFWFCFCVNWNVKMAKARWLWRCPPPLNLLYDFWFFEFFFSKQKNFFFSKLGFTAKSSKEFPKKSKNFLMKKKSV